MPGFAAVQIALMRGATVIATAGDTFAGRLRDLGAKVTSCGDGMVERVREIHIYARRSRLSAAINSVYAIKIPAVDRACPLDREITAP